METRTTPTGILPGKLPENTPVKLQREWQLPLYPGRPGFHYTAIFNQHQESILHNRKQATIKPDIRICAIEIKDERRQQFSGPGTKPFLQKKLNDPEITDAMLSGKRDEPTLSG